MTDNLITLTALLFILLAVGASAIRIVVEYERAVVFTLGRFTGVKGPGLIFIIPFVQTLSRVDLRTIVLDVPTQDLISRDNVSVHVNAVIYFKVVDPERAIIQVEQFIDATSQLAQTTLRSVLGKHELDEMLTERDKLNKDIQEIIDTQTTSWGIKVANVEIKHVDIDETMVRAMAKQAEEAAETLSGHPEAMQLRYLGALSEIAGERSSTIVFPFPVEFEKFFNGFSGQDRQKLASNADSEPKLSAGNSAR